MLKRRHNSPGNRTRNNRRSPFFPELDRQLRATLQCLHCPGIMTRATPDDPRARIDKRSRLKIRPEVLKHNGRRKVVIDRRGLGVIPDELDVEAESLAGKDVFLIGAEDVEGEERELAGLEYGFGLLLETCRAQGFGEEVFVLDASAVRVEGGIGSYEGLRSCQYD